MAHTKYVHFLLVTLLLAPAAFAQTGHDYTASGASRSSEVAAPSQYTQTAGIRLDANHGQTLAQFPQLRRGVAIPARGYPRESYARPGMDHGNAKPILIGAAIGFGIGAAIGANRSAHNGTPVGGGIVVAGGLLGFLGGCVGKAVGDFQGLHYSSANRRRIYRPSWSEDEQSDFRRDSKAKQDYAEVSASPAAPIPPSLVTVAAPPVSEAPALP